MLLKGYTFRNSKCNKRHLNLRRINLASIREKSLPTNPFDTEENNELASSPSTISGHKLAVARPDLRSHTHTKWQGSMSLRNINEP